MLKGQDFDLADLANRNSLTNFIHFKVTLRDKLFFELDVINTTIDFAFDSKKARTRRVIYACNTKWIYKQSVPPGYETGFVSYHFTTNEYDFEISYMDIFVEYDAREDEILKKDSQENDVQVRKLFGKVMENFSYKYNEAAAGKSYLDPVFYSTTAFFFQSFCRNKITGEYELNTGKVIPSVGDKEMLQTKMWDINKALDSKFVMWRFYLNKARYCFSIRMYIDSILYAAISIEAYMIQIIKDNDAYEEYLVFANDGNIMGFTTAKNYIRKNGLLLEEDIKLIDKSYKKIKGYRSKIVHGDTETPYLEKEVVEKVYKALENTFNEIEVLYGEKMTSDGALYRQKNKYHKMSKIQKLCNEHKYNEAIEFLTENIENGMYVDSSYLNRAHCYAMEGLSKEAIEDYKTCIGKKVRLRDAYKGLANEYTKIKEYEMAIETYDFAIETDCNNANLRYRKANLLIALGNHYEAKVEITKAIEIEEKANYYYTKAVAEAYLQELEESIEDYSTAINLEPNTGKHWYGRGQIYFELAIPENAERDIITSIKLDDNKRKECESQELLVAIILMYLEQGKVSDAVRMCKEYKSTLVNNKNYNALMQKLQI